MFFWKAPLGIINWLWRVNAEKTDFLVDIKLKPCRSLGFIKYSMLKYDKIAFNDDKEKK